MTTLSVHIPVIETERLVLREPRFADFDAVHAFSSSDRASFVGGPMADWQSWGSLTSGIGQWVLRGYGFWSVEEKATGTMVGRVGIFHPIDWPEPELGWHIYAGSEGKGYGFEAAKAARHHAHVQMGLGPLPSTIHPDNTRSIALAERLGAQFEREMELRGEMMRIYRHPAEVMQ